MMYDIKYRKYGEDIRTLFCEIPAEHLNPVSLYILALISSTITPATASF